MGLSDYIFVCLMKDQIASLELGCEINEHNVSFLTSISRLLTQPRCFPTQMAATA